MITKENLNKPSLPYEQFNDKGKKIIYIGNIQSKHYYLNVRSKRFKTYFGRDKDLNERGNNLQYLIYYYTTYSDSLDFQDIDKWITHKPHGLGEIQLDLPLIITNDLEANKKQKSGALLYNWQYADYWFLHPASSAFLRPRSGTGKRKGRSQNH